MPCDIEIPKLGDPSDELRVGQLLCSAGARVRKGQPVATIDADKAVLEIEAPDDGALVRWLVREQDVVVPGQTIGILDDGPSDARFGSASPVVTETRSVPRFPGGRPKASPIARRMAGTLGIDLAGVTGSGHQGRIVRRDIERMVEREQSAPVAPFVSETPDGPAGLLAAVRAEAASGASRTAGDDRGGTSVPITAVRRAIARRLVNSLGPVPHFYLARTAEVDAAWKQCREAKQWYPGLSWTDVLLAAIARTLPRHPELNASWDGDHLTHHAHVHLGLAVAHEDGLLTVVLRHADTLTLGALSQARQALVGRARDRRLAPHEMTGATFTLSNLGMFGVEAFQAVINPPEAAILAAGAVAERPVVRDGTLAVGRTVTLTVSVDHRVTDGAAAARFLDELCRRLATPLTLG